jgi:HD-like signal output (HDOD) protein
MNPDEAFLGGLLHDVGIPTLVQGLVEIEARTSSCRDVEEVLLLLKPRHAEVGARLAAAWSMPASLVEAIGCHHDPLQAPNASRSALVSHLADQLAGHPSLTMAPSGHSELCAHSAALGLSEDDVADLAGMRATIAALASSLSG